MFFDDLLYLSMLYVVIQNYPKDKFFTLGVFFPCTIALLFALLHFLRILVYWIIVIIHGCEFTICYLYVGSWAHHKGPFTLVRFCRVFAVKIAILKRP